MTTYIPSLTLPSTILSSPAASILLPLALGNGIGYATRPDRTKRRYRELAQPPYNPPAYVFAPVWTALYGAMGYAAYRAWDAGSRSLNPQTIALAQHGATLYTIQLGLNLAWMPLFFGLERPIEASLDIVTLLGTTAYLAHVWSGVDEVAAWLMVPYLGWLGFATYLSIGCGYLNGWNFKDVPRGEKKDN